MLKNGACSGGAVVLFDLDDFDEVCCSACGDRVSADDDDQVARLRRSAREEEVADSLTKGFEVGDGGAEDGDGSPYEVEAVVDVF